MMKSERAIKAMLAVDRADFTSTRPYEDRPQAIGSHATISAPHMHAAALEHLSEQLRNGARALDVGSGSGYLTAAMAIMAGERGRVVGIEHMEALVNASERNVAKHHEALLRSGRVRFVVGDGREGYEEAAPYDAIHVGAAAPEVPKKLLEQLANGGRMLIPVGKIYQQFMQIDRVGDRFEKRRLFDVSYVPLTSQD